MIFESHTPSPGLASYIESIFYFKELMPDHSNECVVPAGHVFIRIELDGYERRTFDNQMLKPNPALVLDHSSVHRLARISVRRPAYIASIGGEVDAQSLSWLKEAYRKAV